MEFVVLGLGSNRSFNNFSPVELLGKACSRLQEFLINFNVSSVYCTGAMYVTDQDDFYNMTVSGFYEGTPEDLLEKIHEVEGEFGRDRSKEYRNGPRSLDVDIELFGNKTVKKENLVIPHERMTERAFVLVPLLEVLNKNAEINSIDSGFYEKKLKEISDQKIVKYLDSASFAKTL